MSNTLQGLGAIAGGALTGYYREKQHQRAEKDDAFQDERRGRERQTWAKQDEAQAKTDRADAAMSAYIQAQRDQWAQQTGQPPESFRPDLNSQVGALDARGTQLAADGNWRELLTQRAQAAPIYTAARNSAIDKGLAQYDADGDPIKLAQTVYPHIRDGRKITMAKTVTGKDGKASVQFSMDDGSTDAVAPDQLVATLKRLRMDPELAAKMDVEHLKARIKADEDKRKLDHDLTVEGVKQKGARGLADVNNERAVTVANIGAGATRYSADKGAASRVEAAKESSGSTRKVDWTGLASKHFGDTQMGALGGTKTASPRSLGLAVSAQEIYEANKDKPGMTPEKATELAAKALGADRWEK
jgi:hypothetical protein